MKTSIIIGMEIINLYEGQVDGYVKNLIFSKDYKKVKALIVYSDKYEKQYMLEISKIYKLNDVVFIKNSSVFSEINNIEDKSPINLPAYLSDGKSLGVITDIELDNNFNVVNFIANNNTIQNNIAKITNQLIIFNTPDNVINISRMAPKKIVNTELNAAISPIQSNLNNIFLVGRKVTKDIFSFNNELLIKANSIVTERVVRIARLNGKLRELALNVV